MPAVLTLLGSRVDAFSFPALRFLARSWDWVVGRGRWVTRYAVRRRCDRDRPAGGARAPGHKPGGRAARRQHAARLDAGAPGASSASARSWAQAGRALQPRGRLEEAADHGTGVAAEDPGLPGQAGRDERVDSVVGPGAFVAQSKDLKALPKGLKSSAKLLKGGKKDLGRLEKGLGQAGDGAGQLRAGLAAPPTAPASCRLAPAPRAQAPASSAPGSARRAPAPGRSRPGCVTRWPAPTPSRRARPPRSRAPRSSRAASARPPSRSARACRCSSSSPPMWRAPAPR